MFEHLMKVVRRFSNVSCVWTSPLHAKVSWNIIKGASAQCDYWRPAAHFDGHPAVGGGDGVA